MQLISNKKGFTILELLVVLAVMGVFTAIAYPNISSWITDREVKKEVYETVAFIKERKAEVTSGKYGMTQIVLKPNLEVYTMSPQNFFNTYQNISSSSSYKTNKQCDYAWRQSGFSPYGDNYAGFGDEGVNAGGWGNDRDLGYTLIDYGGDTGFSRIMVSAKRHISQQKEIIKKVFE